MSLNSNICNPSEIGKISFTNNILGLENQVSQDIDETVQVSVSKEYKPYVFMTVEEDEGGAKNYYINGYLDVGCPLFLFGEDYEVPAFKIKFDNTKKYVWLLAYFINENGAVIPEIIELRDLYARVYEYFMVMKDYEAFNAGRFCNFAIVATFEPEAFDDYGEKLVDVFKNFRDYMTSSEYFLLPSDCSQNLFSFYDCFYSYDYSFPIIDKTYSTFGDCVDFRPLPIPPQFYNGLLLVQKVLYEAVLLSGQETREAFGMMNNWTTILPNPGACRIDKSNPEKDYRFGRNLFQYYFFKKMKELIYDYPILFDYKYAEESTKPDRALYLQCIDSSARTRMPPLSVFFGLSIMPDVIIKVGTTGYKLFYFDKFYSLWVNSWSDMYNNAYSLSPFLLFAPFQRQTQNTTICCMGIDITYTKAPYVTGVVEYNGTGTMFHLAGLVDPNHFMVFQEKTNDKTLYEIKQFGSYSFHLDHTVQVLPNNEFYFLSINGTGSNDYLHSIFDVYREAMAYAGITETDNILDNTPKFLDFAVYFTKNLLKGVSVVEVSNHYKSKVNRDSEDKFISVDYTVSLNKESTQIIPIDWSVFDV